MALSGCITAATMAAGDPASLERALSWIPHDASSFLVIPDLKRANDDVAQLIEATGQGGILATGRPIDMLKGQLGIGANLDEKAPLVAYYPALVANAASVDLPVFVIAVTDAAAFLSANFTRAADLGDDAFTTTTGLTMYAMTLPGRVALAPSRTMLPTADGARGIGESFHARLREDETVWLERADLVAWASRSALHASAERARAEALSVEVDANSSPIGAITSPDQAAAMRAKSSELTDMLEDGVLVVDADPLGLFIATVGVAQPSTVLASVLSGGKGEGARFDRLPKKLFYLAAALDFDGLGGANKLSELLDITGIPRTIVPPWILSEGSDFSSAQLGIYPSKLGVAIGGALNDSSLVITSRNPALTLTRMKSAVEALAGESVGVRRTPTWTASKTLKDGAIANAFEIKETVFDASLRPALDFERLSKQLIFGAAGVRGLAKEISDGAVMTFSQRPDVFAAAMAAATSAATKSTANTLSSDDTVRSIEEWLPPSRDVEVMIGLGSVLRLARQLAESFSSFVSAEQANAMIPAMTVDAEPIAFTLDVGDGRARIACVMPTAVLAVLARAGMNGAAAVVSPRPTSPTSPTSNATPSLTTPIDSTEPRP